jgi:protoheme IX farnesyltransferase
MTILDIAPAGPTSARRRYVARLGDLLELTKPRVMSLVLFTALVGFLIAPGQRDVLTGWLALLCIAAGAGGAGALNMWYEADLDARMARTARRPIPSGRVSRAEALALGLGMSSVSVMALGWLQNLAAAGLLAFTIFFYAVVYTIWLKPRTAQNIVIGGVAGALPPVIGWVAATGRIDGEPLSLFLIVVLWTPPHFWALSLTRAGEYARAGIPMLPVVAGIAATKRQIVGYSAALVAASSLPVALGPAGWIYAAIAGLSGAALLRLALRLQAAGSDTESRAAHRLFAFSICYLFLLFAGLLADSVLLSAANAAL